MTAADHDGHDGMRENSLACLSNRTLHEPVPGQATTVPREARAQIGNHFGIAACGEQPVLYLKEVAGQLIETVRIMPEQIAFDDDVGDGSRAVACESRFFEERRSEQHELIGAISIRQGR